MNPTVNTPFGFASTADQVIKGVNLAGKRAIVTGGASGIGIETARVLASAGAEVVLAVRQLSLGEEVAKVIRDSTGNPKVRVAHLDLSDLRVVYQDMQWSLPPTYQVVDRAEVSKV